LGGPQEVWVFRLGTKRKSEIKGLDRKERTN